MLRLFSGYSRVESTESSVITSLNPFQEIRKSWAVLCLFLLSFIPDSSAQNLYDYQHSLIYGNYLLNTRQYTLATEEFERLLFMNPANDTLKQKLVRSYLFDGSYQSAIRRTDSLFQNRAAIPQPIAVDYSRALILGGMHFMANQFLEESKTISEKDRTFLILNNQLLAYNWKDAENTYNSMLASGQSIDMRYKTLFQDMNNARYKSPGLALGMSALLPGSGKVYTGEWKDGLVSLLFVTGSVIQAIRGHQLYGEKSAFFIAYTGLATTFYLGNLYGSFKSARKHNDKIRHQLHRRMADTFTGTF